MGNVLGYKTAYFCVQFQQRPSLDYLILLHSFKETLSGFFPWGLPVVKISPEWVTGPKQGKSSGRVATFSLWAGVFRDGISSIPG